MPRTWSIRLQIALVIALFLGSLATVLFSTFQTLLLPQREFDVRDRLREASRRMAEAAAHEVELQSAEEMPFETLNKKLRAISSLTLARYPEVEGGFYLDAPFNRFAGYAFPTEPEPADPRGDDPPPKERPIILDQAKDSLAESLADVRTVGPSRVAIATEPVGPKRPARWVSWTMFRLISPETLQSQVRRYQISTGLALGGIALAVILTINLGRTLRRQRLEQERLRDELRRSEHLAALGKLLAGVAHEVRNPLAGIRSTVQLWERLPDTARTQGSIQAIVQAVDRLNDIVSRLLYFSRSDRAERQPIQVNDVLSETLGLLEAQASSQAVSLELERERNLPEVLASASALQQVFLNLTTNALQAMPHGGRLHCLTGSLPEGHRIEIRFADTGPGISLEDRKHLFEPFFTTRPEGTGLGLALCREIVLQHGGQIELADGGPGTTFCVTLPTRHEQ